MYKFVEKPIKVVAHRGDSMFYPENSILAFESAVKLGVDVIETDVHISSDGVIFVWHDDDTFKLDGNRDFLYNRKWSDLKDKKVELVKGFYKILEDNHAFDRVLAASFSSRNLKQMRKISNKVSTSYGRGEVKFLVILSKLKLSWLTHIFWRNLPPVMQIPEFSGRTRLITKSFVKTMQKKGVKMQVWTINKKKDMKRLYELGVDGVMTDDPRTLLEVAKKI